MIDLNNGSVRIRKDKIRKAKFVVAYEGPWVIKEALINGSYSRVEVILCQKFKARKITYY